MSGSEKNFTLLMLYPDILCLLTNEFLPITHLISLMRLIYIIKALILMKLIKTGRDFSNDDLNDSGLFVLYIVHLSVRIKY